jgi:acetylornithine deacetylase/succinyl-diaminopimelate desuccinylase-like protein
MRLACLLLLAAAPARALSDVALATVEAREHLRALIRFDTSNPPGNELPAAEYLKEKLDAAGIPADLYVSTGSRASGVARLKAPKASRQRRPIILMCHTDVVPADPKEWATDPFSPVEKDGYIIGRGAADNKDMCAAELAVLVSLKRSTVPMSRDVLFFAEADEESGEKDRHIDWLLRAYPDLLDARYAINEGGNTIWEKGRPVEMRVETAEKVYLDVTVAARGEAGHASVPRPDNAVAAIARAVTRLSEHRFKARLNDTVQLFLQRQAQTEEPEVKAAIFQVLRAAPGEALDAAADRLAAAKPEFGAMLRDTLSPTILSGGYKSNVIPASAEATFNARLLPGRDPADFLEELARVVDNPAVEVRADTAAARGSEVMPADTEFYRAIEASARELSPGIVVMPFMAAWTTDSQKLRERGVITYGVEPPMGSVEQGVHGKNERLLLDALDWYVRFLHKLVVKAAEP